VVSLTIPIFDWGATRSRERQARLRVQVSREPAHGSAGAGLLNSSMRREPRQPVRRARAPGSEARAAGARQSGSFDCALRAAKRNIAVTDAQTMLVTQRTALYQALFDYQTALRASETSDRTMKPEDD